MKLCCKLGIVAVAVMSLGISTYPAEVAILRNGSDIRYERREKKDAVTTRLYLTETSHDYVDVPTGEILRIELEDIDLPEIPVPTLALAPRPASTKSLVRRPAHATESTRIAQASFSPS